MKNGQRDKEEEIIRKVTTESLSQSYGYKTGEVSEADRGLEMHPAGCEGGGIRNSSRVKRRWEKTFHKIVVTIKYTMTE